ncbi:MAG: LPS assembly lipoprotein LptE [Pseudomonadota bacterium]
MRNYRLAIRLWLTVLLALQLNACGFHLRGAVELPEVMTRTHVVGGGGTDLYYELENALLNAGAEVVTSAEAATGTLTLHKQQVQRRVLSVDSQGRAAEYELTLQLAFSLKDSAGRIIADNERLSIVRDYSFDPDSVLGREAEEQALRREMERFAVSQMMRRLQSLARRPAPEKE